MHSLGLNESPWNLPRVRVLRHQGTDSDQMEALEYGAKLRLMKWPRMRWKIIPHAAYQDAPLDEMASHRRENYL